MAAATWNLKQHFSVRASTVLLLYLGTVFIVGVASARLPEPLRGWAHWLLNFLGVSTLFIMVAAPLLPFALFVASVIQRRPQIQYLVECIIGISIIVLWPTH